VPTVQSTPLLPTESNPSSLCTENCRHGQSRGYAGRRRALIERSPRPMPRLRHKSSCRVNDRLFSEQAQKSVVVALPRVNRRTLARRGSFALRRTSEVSNKVPNFGVQNQVARAGLFLDAFSMTLEMKKLASVDSGGALSSAVEHILHTDGVVGSNPTARTIFLSNIEDSSSWHSFDTRTASNR
jgi:hypothetical protein